MESCSKFENQGEKLQKKHRKPMHKIIDGVPRCPRLKPDDLREALQFRPGAGDLLQSTFPKSGSHWMMYIVQLILRNGEPMESYQDFLYGWCYLEYMGIESWQSPLPLRVIMTHLPLSEETFSPEAKYIYVARNPWDVCVSFYHMARNLNLYEYEDATFDEFVDAFVDGNFGYGDFFKHVAAAYDLREKPNVLFVTYEEMKKNTKGVVLKVARFLGEQYGRALAGDEPLLNELLNRSGAEFMRDKVVVDFKDFPDPNCTEQSEKSYVSCKEGYKGDNTKFSMVRSAKVGGWKHHFTPHLLERMEERIREAEKMTSFMDLWRDIRTEAINLMALH